MAKELTPNSLEILRARYLLRNIDGKVMESPQELFKRVAEAVASPEGRQRKKWTGIFEEMISNLRFMPNSPTLMNAGKKRSQLSACFVLPVEDSLDEIFQTLRYAALIQQSGGGTGFAFSRVRPRGAIVQSSHGVASGPMGFIRIFDTATETVKQGGTRRGANMAVLRVDHPDILDFIRSKLDQRQILNFNISIGVTDEFMRAVNLGGKYDLKDPRTGKAVKHVLAREVFEAAVQAAWSCGDPGIVFLDRINFFNPTPKLGQMESTNPCGEQPLLPWESCNLGSLNLGSYFSPSGLNWRQYREDIHHAVRFLDNVIEVNDYPVPQTRAITRKNRKIGLGVMGFADLLIQMKIPYDSPEARGLGEQLMAFLAREAREASATLAKTRGAFPSYRGSLWERLGYPKLRNATVSTVAPTGTISMIAGCSSGIEPIFSGVFYRNVLDGSRLLDVHPAVARALGALAEKPELITDQMIAKKLGAVWSPAGQVPIDAHVRMQAVFQRHSDSAVSKTVNLPQNSSQDDVAQVFLLAYQLGCKGITIYRDQSRSQQVLEKPRPPNAEEESGEAFCPSC